MGRRIEEMVAAKRACVEAALDAVLDAIERLLKARRIRRGGRGNDGQPQTVFVDDGPDHRTATKAAMLFVRLFKRTAWFRPRLVAPRYRRDRHIPPDIVPERNSGLGSGAASPRSNASAAHARCLRITERLLQGKTVTAIAREGGISRQTASRVVNSPESQRILDEIIAGYTTVLR